MRRFIEGSRSLLPTDFVAGWFVALFDYLEGEEGLNEFSEDFPHLKFPAIQVLETIARKFAVENVSKATVFDYEHRKRRAI